MNHSKTIWIVTLAVVSVARAGGPTIDLDLVHSATFDKDFNQITLDDLTVGPSDPTNLQQVDVVMSLNNLAPDEDFFRVGFDLNLGPGLSDVFGWVPASGSFDHDGIPITPPQNHWWLNQDWPRMTSRGLKLPIIPLRRQTGSTVNRIDPPQELLTH